MQVPITGSHLKLAAHVRACQVEGPDHAKSNAQVILLDLHQNRYLGISGTAAKVMAGKIKGFPGHCESAAICAESTTNAATDTLIQRLRTLGMLTHNSCTLPHDDPFPIQSEEATASLEHNIEQPKLTVRKIGNFLASAAVAAWWLRWRSLHWIAVAVVARRDQLKAPPPDSAEAMKNSIAAYEALRPFAFTARDRCLHDSLALVSFLATEGLRAHWVIGVRANPFAAHSWVQSGHTVLNDSHEHVRQFRPILFL